MYKGKRVSLILPAFDEEKNIAGAIDDFRKVKIFDEIIVVDNNSTDKTAQIAKKKRVKVVSEKSQGYGFALRRGMKEAVGDFIFLSEPDGTFAADDSLKLIKHAFDYDMVTGARTNKKFISEQANMSWPLRFGNKSLAKLIQLLYSPNTSLSDCGCTFRVMNRKLVKKILPKLKVGDSHFLAELVILSLLFNFKILEIPVKYRKRVGYSKITGVPINSIMVGLRMSKLIIESTTLAAK